MNEYYPMLDEENFQEKLLTHSEFNELIYKSIESKDLTNEEKMLIIKSRVINDNIILKPYQEFVSRFISSYTPYNSLLLFHSPGSGKTLSLLRILRNNIDYIVNQNSYIYILVPRKLLKHQWNNEIIKYIPEMIDYIKILTYKSMYNKVLGEKKINIDENTLKTYKDYSLIKTDFSEYENSILVLEEVHNVTNNNYTVAISKIRDNVKQMKVLALTATPIKNLMDEIIDIFNFLIVERKLNKRDYFNYIDNKPILYNADKLQKDITGYVSTININNSIYLSKKIEIGKIVPDLETIKICEVKCSKIYESLINLIRTKKKDSLGKIYESISNIILPYISTSNVKLIPIYGNKGYNMICENLKSNKKQYNSLLSNIFEINEPNLLYLNNENKLSGKLFSLKYIYTFSPKMYYIFKLLNHLTGNIFIYSSFKSIVIDIFGELLINEGYTDYSNPNKGIESQKICYSCCQKKSIHSSLSHEWSPLTFFICSSNDNTLIDTLGIFNSSSNIDGKYIKIILASMMINEGINLKNVIHVIKFDAPLTISRNEQIERRAIRLNSHNDYIIRNNKIPTVFVYNIALVLSNGSSVEINNYKLAENKFKNNKVIYSILEKASIDYNVYNSEKTYSGKNTNSTISLIEKDNKIYNIIKYITNMFTTIKILSYTDLLNELKPKFNELSIMISLKYLIDNEKIFIITMRNIIYIFSNIINFKEEVDTKFLNIHNFYNITNTTQGESYYYDLDYLNSKKIFDICGIVSNKFKLKFTNKFIDNLKLDIVKSKYNNNILKGWICNQSINKENMKKISKYFNLNNDINRLTCDDIYKHLYDMEKYSLNNIQFLIYPNNYNGIPFPLNIYDRHNIILTKYESKGYKIIDDKQIKLKETISLGQYTFEKVIFKFTCIKENENSLTITID